MRERILTRSESCRKSTRRLPVKSFVLTSLLMIGMTSFAPAPIVAAESPLSPSMTLRQDMRKLWTDHVVWTRDYIIAAVADQPDAQAAANRLMTNQEDIGNAIATYYGKPAGDKLTSLLKEHISTAVDVIKFAKVGDKASQKQADDKWHKNGEDIADFLSKANPNWPK